MCLFLKSQRKSVDQLVATKHAYEHTQLYKNQKSVHDLIVKRKKKKIIESANVTQLSTLL
jgi:hypothetical protein